MTCQRWRLRRDSYRPVGEPIDPSRYGVELIVSDKLAKSFVQTHHYSGSYPAAVCRVGLYRMRELVGVAVFAVPAQEASIPYWTGTDQGVVLSRFVLLEDVPANGETWFLARAFEALRSERPECQAVLSYSDPLPRRRADGTLLTPGHIGVIYQAFNGRYVGRGRADVQYINAEGRTFNRRSLTKLKNGERGADGVYRKLLEYGAPERKPREKVERYLHRALRTFTEVRHPGNHAYVWALGEEARDRRPIEAKFKPALPFPRRPGDPRDPQGGLFGVSP